MESYVGIVPVSLAETERTGDSARTTSHWLVGGLSIVYRAVFAEALKAVEDEPNRLPFVLFPLDGPAEALDVTC